MAEQVTFIGHLTPVSDTLVAAEDLSGAQFKFVSVHPAGVLITHSASVSDGNHYVLGLKANSGEAVSLNLAPNVARVIAGAAITLGKWCEPGSGGLAITSSLGNPNAIGVALTSAGGSGTYISLHIRR
jgi:hypothetical protein